MCAGRLARRLGTVNVHAKYSSAECILIREAALAEVGRHSRFIAAHVANAKLREASGVPLRFHDQIRSLWEYDLALQLNDSDVKKESAFAAALIQELVTGGISEPANYRKVAHHPQRQSWVESMGRERSTLEERETWELVPKSSIGRHRPVRCKYVYKLKQLKDGSLNIKADWSPVVIRK